jgi:hypothetical protein
LIKDTLVLERKLQEYRAEPVEALDRVDPFNVYNPAARVRFPDIIFVVLPAVPPTDILKIILSSVAVSEFSNVIGMNHIF